MSIICSNCGHDNQSDAQYCDECGVELIAPPVEKYSVEEYIPNINNEEEIAPQALEEEFQPITNEADEAAELNSTGNEDLDGYVEEVPSEVSVASTPSIPIGTPTRLELDEPEIVNTPLKSPATTIELPQAALVEQETGARYELPTAEKVIHIGRLNDEFPIHVDLSNISDADLISRIHASIHLENDLYYLEDAGSANGTWLNGEAIKPGTRFRQQLHHGDTIAFGRNQTIKLTLELD